MRRFVLVAWGLSACSASPLPPVSITNGQRQTSSATVVDKSGYAYDPGDRSCDGFPRLQVGTMDGTCLGLVLGQTKAAASVPWKMPRTIQQIPGTGDFLVVDMGGWVENRGALYYLRKKNDGTFDVSTLKAGLNMPHALKRGPGNFFYLGETDKVWRFNVDNGKLVGWEPVVTKLPRYKGYMHPLVTLAFDPRNDDMYINSGAPSDHCFVKNHEDYSDCPEDVDAGLAVIFRVPGEQLKTPPPGGITKFQIAAHGLRNSMAMEITPAGLLVQGENSRDFPQLEEPYEEINVVDLAEGRRERHYGWPYCYDFHGVSPEWKFSQNLGDELHRRFTAPVDCSAKEAKGAKTYQPPYILMPPHAAPLHLGYYPARGQLAGLLGGRLLVSWHGYQPTGHRLVAYNVDGRGLPRLSPTVTGRETYSFDVKGACPAQRSFKPDGGLDRFAAYQEVISQWDEVKGVRPKGAPVAFTVAEDGSIYLVEDKNHAVVRLARSDRALPSHCANVGNAVDPRIEMLAWRNVLENNPAAKAGYVALRDQVIAKNCTGCHGGFLEDTIASDGYGQLDFLVKNDFFVPHNTMASKLRQALAGTGEVPLMPPADVTMPDADRAAAVKIAEDWIDSLPAAGVGASFKKTSMKESRKLRAAPSTAAQECGQVNAGDVLYVDPRPEQLRRKDGWSWSKVYMLPGDTRLYKENACAAPADGVYYLGVSKL